jgi:hypothetical protein
MRRPVKSFLAVLDGQPVGVQGQSMVELALTIPIFIIMIAGLAEIGWFANNYLIMSDVVRSAGRYGSIRSPFEFDDAHFVYDLNAHDCEVAGTSTNSSNTYNLITVTGATEISSPPPNLPPTLFNHADSVANENQTLGFYDGIACSAVFNMAPLELDREKDDIVISVFGYTPYPVDCDFDPLTTEPECSEMRISGRWPVRSNECTADPGDSRDPFDLNQNNTGDTTGPLIEVSTVFGNPTYQAFDPGTESVRGYILLGNQAANGSGSCRGSRFSLTDVEDRLNDSVTLGATQNLQDAEFDLVPAYGLVLVEIQWHSYQLLGLPFFNIANPIELHIWGIFPLSAAEPDF